MRLLPQKIPQLLLAVAACVPLFLLSNAHAVSTVSTINLPPSIDTTINSRQKNVNFTNSLTVSVQGFFTPGEENGRSSAVFKFDLSSLPANAVIDKAELKLFVEDIVVNNSLTLKLNKVTSDWDQDLVWGDSAEPVRSEPLTVRTVLESDVTQLKNNYFNLGGDSELLTRLVSDWFQKKESNRGLILSSDNQTADYHLIFTSSESTETAKNPALVVTYSQPAAITEVRVDDITDKAATIHWRTDKDSTSYVSFGKDTTYGKTTGLDPLTSNHSVTIEGLEAETQYHFKVKSTDDAGNVSDGEDQVFLTLKTEVTATSATTTGEEEINPPQPNAQTPPVEAPKTNPATPAATNSKNPPQNVAATTQSSANGDLALANNADQFATKPGSLDKSKDVLLSTLPFVGGIALIVLIFRLTIGNYMGAAQEETSEETDFSLPPQPFNMPTSQVPTYPPLSQAYPTMTHSQPPPSVIQTPVMRQPPPIQRPVRPTSRKPPLLDLSKPKR